MIEYILKEPRNIKQAISEVASPKGTDVLIRIHHVGICGSDIHLFKGTYSAPHTYPMLFGHEWAGVVEAIGEKVTKVTVGDLVTGDCSRYCGKCPNCEVNKNLCSHIEKFGITIDGASAEYILRDEMYLYKAPKDLRRDLLCLSEPVAVAANLIKKVHDVTNTSFAEKKVLVMGGGVIGMSAAMLLRHMDGCKDVSLYDISHNRVSVAAAAGMTIPTKEELEIEPSGSDYSSMYANAKYDIVLETTGVGAVFANTFNLVKPGGVLGCVGMIANVTIPQKLIVTKGLAIVGSIGGTGSFEDAMKFIRDYPQYAEKLISHHFPICDFEDAFNTACNTNISMKVVLDL